MFPHIRDRYVEIDTHYKVTVTIYNKFKKKGPVEVVHCEDGGLLYLIDGKPADDDDEFDHCCDEYKYTLTKICTFEMEDGLVDKDTGEPIPPVLITKHFNEANHDLSFRWELNIFNYSVPSYNSSLLLHESYFKKWLNLFSHGERFKVTFEDDPDDYRSLDNFFEVTPCVDSFKFEREKEDINNVKFRLPSDQFRKVMSCINEEVSKILNIVA